MTTLLIVCRDPISRAALSTLATGVAFAEPAQATATVRADPPRLILVDADEPDSVVLIMALSLAATAPIFAIATAVVDPATVVQAGAHAVFCKSTGRTVLPGDPCLAAWRDAIGEAA